MESAQDIAAQIAATRERFEQLAGPIESSKGQAEAFADALAQLGLEERSAKAKTVADRVEQHQSLRAGIAGGLAKAHWLMLSVANGTMGPGANGPTSSVIDNSDGTVSWHGTVDGIKTEIQYGTPKENEPDPNGEELLAPRRPKNKAEAFLQSMVREDVTDPAKSVGNAMDPAGALFNREAPPTPASSSTTAPAHGQAVEGAGWIAEIRQPMAEVGPIPIPTLSTGNLLELTMVATAMLMKASPAVASKMDNLRKIAKEHRRDGH